MSQPNQPPPSTINISQALPASDYKLTLEPTETDEDAQARRTKDTSVFIVALIMVCIVFVVSLGVLLFGNPHPEDKKWLFGTVTAIVGALLGRVTK
jgi:hypothetical protein